MGSRPPPVTHVADDSPDAAHIDAPSAAGIAFWPWLVVMAMTTGWAALFGWLALQRHFAGGSHAEDLGFTEQVLANFLRGHWFRMSIYQGATWNTELDLSRIPRPDSLLAFHFEPMLLVLVPLYAVGGISLVLAIQAIGVAAGAVPAYRLGRSSVGSPAAGLAVAAAYLLSPLGQWAVLDDFHTSTLAAPLLLLAVERLVVRKSTVQALLVCGLAATAREDVGVVIGVLGAVILVCGSFASPRWPNQSLQAARQTSTLTQPKVKQIDLIDRIPGLALLALGFGASILGVLVIRIYNGGLPFDARYSETIGGGLAASVAALGRPGVIGYAQTVLASGGWLGLLAPLSLVPALPILALNALSTSPWMGAGKAHYSALVLPFLVVGAAAGLRRLRGAARLGQVGPPGPRRILAGSGLVHVATAGLVLTSVLGYVREGSGPFAGNYAPAFVTPHALRAANVADSLPTEAAVSASSALVPRLSSRDRVYVFPAVLDADYVYVDLHASPSPTSAGDVFMRVQALAASGEWQIQSADDGLLVLHRAPDAGPAAIGPMLAEPTPTLADNAAANLTEPPRNYADGRLSLLSAELVPSPDGAVDVDGPRWILRTTWRAAEPLPSGSRLEFWITLRDGQQMHVWDIAPLWWHPPDQWTPGQPVTIEVPDVPIREFASWQAVFSVPAGAGSQ